MIPVNNYILVNIGEEQKTNENGLYIPKNTDISGSDILKEGTVEEVSSEIKGIVKGNTIYFNKHAITKVPHHSNLVLVRKEDVYMIE